MNEEEWLNCVEPQELIQFLGDSMSERKRRLFIAHCCQQGWGKSSDAVGQQAVQLVRRIAELGQQKPGTHQVYRVSTGQFVVSCGATDPVEWQESTSPGGMPVASEGAQLESSFQYAVEAILCNQPVPWDPHWCHVFRRAGVLYPWQCWLLRELAPPPFRPVCWRYQWRLEDQSFGIMARNIYHQEAFDALPILADALEDAGCTEAELLAHLRSPVPHALGCWALDVVLGKC